MEKKTPFEILTEGFQSRNSRSHDKQTLLNKEIEAHEKLFDETLCSLPLEINSNRRPISGLHYTDGDILRIREAYKKFIVNGADINQSGELHKAPVVVINEEGKEVKLIIDKRLPPTDLQIHYYDEAKVRFDYLQFLRKFKPKNEDEVQDDPIESLFVNKANADTVIDLFKDHEDLNADGKWISQGSLKKIGTAFWVLEDMKLLKPGANLTRMRIWCKGLGLEKRDNELRNIQKRPDYNRETREDYQEFSSLFQRLT